MRKFRKFKHPPPKQPRSRTKSGKWKKKSKGKNDL